MKNKLRLAFAFTFLLLIVTSVNADVFVCIDHGKKVLKNTDTCLGKAKGVYLADEGYLSYSEYKAKQANNEAASSQTKNTKATAPTLDELKSHCGREFNDIANYNSGDTRVNDAIATLTKNKCQTTSMGCYQDYQNLIDQLKMGNGPGDQRILRRISSSLRAKCGQTEEQAQNKVCNIVGNLMTCDDGTTYNKFGNTVIGTDGTSAQNVGNFSLGSDGSSSRRVGNTIYNSDGTTCEIRGNQLICK